MRAFHTRNINEAFPLVLDSLKRDGIQMGSRNGPVIAFPSPVSVEYTHPRERVLMLKERKLNPIFAIVETIWMLAGREDLVMLLPFNSNMAKYSDDGEKVRGSAYGMRWRNWFGYDQLISVVKELQNRESRRAVLTMWDAREDLNRDSKDLPCNLQIIFRVLDGKLLMTVMNRSNDMIYGAFNTNVIHFSLLQEVLAGAMGLEMGSYWQISNNFHAYSDDPLTKYFLEEYRVQYQASAYEVGTLSPYNLAHEINTSHKAALTEIEKLGVFLDQCLLFCDWVDKLIAKRSAGLDTLVLMPYQIKSAWLRNICAPMVEAWLWWKFSDRSLHHLTISQNIGRTMLKSDLHQAVQVFLSNQKFK